MNHARKRKTHGTLGSIATISDQDTDETVLDLLEQDAASEIDGFYPTEVGVDEGMNGLGAMPKWEYTFCGNTPNPSYAQAVKAREAMRQQLATLGVATFPGRPWQASEQAAWNAYNVSRGLKPMTFGKYPMGTQCGALLNGPVKIPGGPSGVAGFGDEAAATTTGQTVVLVAVVGLLGYAAYKYL